MVKKKKNASKPITEEPVSPEEQSLFVSLRASSWSEFEGQEAVKKNLKLAISAARKRKNLWSIYFCMARPDWAKPLLPT